MEENGFALDAYCVPKCGRDGPVPGGTMPKASNEAGSLFTEVKKNAKYPGPDYYKKEGKPFGQKAPLGQFSRIARDDPNAKKNWPAVGQYETITPLCTPRTRGGIMAKSTRGCLIYDQAVMEGKWKPAPGKYDPQKPEAHVDCLAISPDKEQSGKNNKKAVQLGPGYYSPNFGVMEKRQPAFQVPRQEARAAFISKDKAVVSKTEKNMGNSTPFHQSSTSTNVRPAQAGKMPSAQSVQWCAMVAVGFLASEALQRWRRQQSLAAVRREQIDFEEMLSQEAGPSEGAQSSAEAKPTSDEASKPEEKLFGLRTLLEALQVSELVTTETIEGPFQLNPGEQTPLVCFQFKMSHFVCKVYLAAGAEEGTRHLKLQTIFEDNRNSLIEEHRYFMANEWNSSKPYTRLQCGSRDRGQTNVFTLEYDLLCPVQLPHYSGVHLLASTLRMWYTSMMACVLHIVAPRDLPFATHTMIVENTLSVAVREEDGLQNEACPICLENFQVGDKVRRLPCMHLFHVVGGEASLQGRHCNIDRHLVLDKQCPICKTPIDIMEQVERDGAQRAQPAVSQPGESAQGGEQPATPAPVEETQAEVSRPAQSPAAESQEATQQTRQSEAGLPEQAAELERVVRSLQSRWLQIQDVVAGVQQMLHYIEDSQSALSAVRENAAAMTRTGDADPADPPAEQLEESQEAPENPDVPAETPATEVAMQRPEAPEAPEAEPESPATAATAAAEAVQAAATATTSDDRQVPMEAANWQPFTMAEKVCNAYTWRRRRLGMLKEMSAASSTTT